jgi:hypothetical protein
VDIALVRRFLTSRLLRASLAVLVVVSLVPLGSVERTLRPVFLLVFGAELLARWLVWRKSGRSETPAELAFTIADILAFISFLPIELVVPDQHVHLLALLRLTRLLMLLRFAKDIALDVYAIITRREQLQQLGLVTGAVLFLSFVSAVILSQLGLPHDDSGQNGFLDQLWWSFRSMESADNLVPTLRNNPIVVVLSLGLTVTGVFVISFIIGIGTTIVDQVVRTERRRALTYHAHTVVIGPVHASEVLVREFVKIYAKNRQIPSPERLFTWLRHASVIQSAKAFPRIALLGRGESPPDYLYEPLMRWVVYREGDAAEPASLERISAADAKRAILLARSELEHEADAVTIATLAAFRAMNPHAHAFVEVTDSGTVPIAKQVGGPGTFPLDVPRVLGMFMCQHLITPGVERLYRDLLTSEGSEIYTHVFVDETERAALRAKGEVFIPWARIEALAHRHGVTLIGVFLGAHEASRGAHTVVNIDGLVPWLNPLVLPDDDPLVAQLGAQPGLVPVKTLRGLIGIAESYLPLKALADAVAHLDVAHAPAEVPDDAPVAAVAAAVRVLPPHPARVVMIGASDSLPALLRELARYVPGVDVTLFMSQRGDEVTPLPRRLERLEIGIDVRDPLPGFAGRKLPLERGGHIRIFTHEGPDLVGFAANVLKDLAPVEAAVFLCEPEGAERDARTALRILRFTSLLEQGKVPHGDDLHVLAEFQSVEKGAHIQKHVDAARCGFAHESCLRLTLVSTDTIKNYFMVHSAFVPGTDEIYLRLLEERGQEVMRVHLDASLSVERVTMRILRRALARRHAIPIAIELTDRRVLLAPAPDEVFATKDVAGVYVLVNEPGLRDMKR